MIWVAITIGSLLGSNAHHASTMGAQLLSDFRPIYRHLWDQRLDGFLVGLLTGLSSHLIATHNQPRQSMAAIGLCAAFAISSTVGRSQPTIALDEHGPAWSCLTRQTSLAMVAAVAGWLIGSAR